MTQTMQAIVCAKPVDDLSTTALAEVEVPEPASAEVLVRVGAASLNPVDWKLCAGVAPWWQEPHIVGLDAAGTIVKKGSEAGDWEVGDTVLWHADLNTDGVFAEYAVAPAHVLAKVPATVDCESAAALPCAAYTAYQGLIHKARIISGETVLIQGVSGGVGGFAVQLAKLHGCKVIALCRPEMNLWAEKLGADRVLDYRAENLPDAVRAINGGEGVDVMLEVVNPGDARRSLDMLRYNGQLITVDPLPDLSRTPPYTYAASIHEVALGGAYAAGHYKTQQQFASMGESLLQLLEAGRLDPMITHSINLDAVPDWLKRLRAGSVHGKVVVTMGKT